VIDEAALAAELVMVGGDVITDGSACSRRAGAGVDSSPSVQAT
jgi:hypothetical protein